LPLAAPLGPSDWSCSHLTALSNDNVLGRLAFWVGHGPCVLDLGDDVHAFDDVAEDDVLAIQMWCAALCCDDEELAAIRVGATEVSVYLRAIECMPYPLFCMPLATSYRVSEWWEITYCHREKTWFVMLQREVLIRKLFRPVDRS
jgi:hypothetical protein